MSGEDADLIVCLVVHCVTIERGKRVIKAAIGGRQAAGCLESWPIL